MRPVLPELLLDAWRRSGRYVAAAGRDVFVRESGPEQAAVVVLLHGFPGSSYDWAGIVDTLAVDHRVLCLDLPGYGFSDKEPRASYSLFDQADVVEAVLRERAITRCTLLAHDMGDTVVAELAVRHRAGRLGFAIERLVLTNGSIFSDQARLTRGQRLTVRLPDRALPFSVPEPVLRRSLLESFAADAPPPPGAIDLLVAMITHDDGDRLLPRLIGYLGERRQHQTRWTAGLVDFAGPLHLVWGALDPIALPAMTERLVALRPATTRTILPGVGHWPAIEAPERLTAEVLAALQP